MTKQFISELKKYDSVESHFAVMTKGPVTEYKNGYSFTLRISDRTGEIDLKYWGGRDEEEVNLVYRSFSKQDIVQVSGKVGEFRGELQISVNPPPPISKLDVYDIGDLLRATTKNIEEMKTRLRLVIEEIGDIHMKRLLKDLFNDPVFFGQYAWAPAAMSRHHNYAGGLLEHVLSLVDLAKSVTRIHPKLDPDLLVTGCILHDIGKLAEYKLGTTINYTNEGNLLGHISMGHRMVADRDVIRN